MFGSRAKNRLRRWLLRISGSAGKPLRRSQSAYFLRNSNSRHSAGSQEQGRNEGLIVFAIQAKARSFSIFRLKHSARRMRNRNARRRALRGVWRLADTFSNNQRSLALHFAASSDSKVDRLEVGRQSALRGEVGAASGESQGF